LSRKSGLSKRYWFYGACYEEAVIGEMYYNATACISPGNVGLTAIHSLMYGCPVITHSDFSKQMPEFEAIRVGSTGDFFEYGNAGSLAETIEAWLKGHYPKNEALRNDCFRIIDEKFNPYYQIKVLNSQLLTLNS
jgi:glycosyltransferase involved in cell wall biosynthesis